MHRYYRTAMHLAELNQTLLQLFDQGILHAHEADLVVSINRRFELRNGRLQACYPSLFCANLCYDGSLCHSGTTSSMPSYWGRV